MFKVFTNTGAVSRHQAEKKIAPISAREILEERIRSDKAMATDPWYKTRIDQADAKKNLRTFQRTYDKNCPETLDPSAKNMMWKRAKELKDSFCVGMLSTDELHPVKSFVHEGVVKVVVDEEKLKNLNSVKRESAWQEQNGKKVKEYKNIMRHLCPSDPGATNIERFRPIRRIK